MKNRIWMMKDEDDLRRDGAVMADVSRVCFADSLLTEFECPFCLKTLNTSTVILKKYDQCPCGAEVRGVTRILDYK